MSEGDPTSPDTSQSQPEVLPEAPIFKDRKIGLLVFGILLLLMASFAAAVYFRGLNGGGFSAGHSEKRPADASTSVPASGEAGAGR